MFSSEKEGIELYIKLCIVIPIKFSMKCDHKTPFGYSQMRLIGQYTFYLISKIYITSKKVLEKNRSELEYLINVR